MRAREIYEALAPFQGQHHWVLLDRILGMLAATLGNLEAAERHFKSAARVAMRGGIKPELALSLAEQGAAFRRSSDPEIRAAATAMLANAVQRLRDLGMQTKADHYTVLLAPGSTQPATQQLPAGLTAREAEVLALVAEGLTNRKIGEQLGISQKTVTNHLTHIFMKADLDNRSAAVAFAIRHGLAR